MLIAINYHYVRPRFDAPHPGIFGITPDVFAAQLDELARWGSFVGANDLLAATSGQRSLPARSWLVTFDDGLREQFEFAWPVLERKGIPALFFANTAPLQQRSLSRIHKLHQLRAQVAPEQLTAEIRQLAEQLGVQVALPDATLATRAYVYDSPEVAQLKHLLNYGIAAEVRDEIIDTCFTLHLGGREAELFEALYMDAAMLTELASADSLGSHAHEHVALAPLAADEARRQLRLSRDLLREWTGHDPRIVSYPYGHREACSLELAALAAQEGFELGLTMERAANPDLHQPLLLGRFACNDVPGGSAQRWDGEKFFDSAPSACWYREGADA